MDQGTNVTIHMYGIPKMIRKLMGLFWDETTMQMVQVICASCFGGAVGIQTLRWRLPQLTHATAVSSREARRQGTFYADSPPPPLPPWKLAGECRTMGAEGARSKLFLNK